MANSLGSIQVGWGSQWETLANAINDYYGGGVSSAQYQQVVNMLNSGEYTMSEMEEILGNIPEFNRTYNANGELIGVSYKATSAGNTTVGNIANEINSNAATATNTQFSTVQTITKDAQTGKVTMSDSVKKYNAGSAPTTVKAVASSAVQGVLATSVGITLGKTIDQLAYDSGFNWLSWAGVDMESLNPQSWAGITAGDDSFGAKLFNFVFQIDDNTGNPQAYIDENAFAYMTAYMLATGALESESDYEWDGEAPADFELTEPIYSKVETFEGTYAGNPVTCYYYGECLQDNHIRILGMKAEDNDDIKVTSGVVDGWVQGLKCSKEPIQNHIFFEFDPSTMNYTGVGVGGSNSYTYDDKTVYYSGGVIPGAAVSSFGTNSDNFASIKVAQLAWILQYGNFVTHGIEGIGNQPGAKQFDSSGIYDYTNIAAILLALQSQFPELWDNRIEVSPDGENIIKYIPVAFPTGGTGQNPTTSGATQSDLAPDISDRGDNVTDELIKTLIDMIQNPMETGGMESDTTTPTKPIDPNEPGTGSGNTPVIIMPTGSAEALYSVYNPTQAQLNSFGSWLWSSNFVDQLLKLFNDPMQAIIGLHKIFATPSIGGTSTIRVGYLDSGVSSKTVSNQYTEVDCGTVSLPEYFKNCLDYTDTDIYIYLPFIGIEALNVEDVTRAKINVKYKVDVLTGACLAMVNVTRDSNSGGQLYVYPGNCAVQYPLSSGSYMGIVTAGLSAAATIAGIVGTGGAAAPALTAANVAKGVGKGLGVASGFMASARNNVSRSGNLSGNSGAMGIKKPYLIIRRPQTKIADNFNMDGISENKYGVLSSFTGMTKVKYIHLENIPCTGDELTMIEDILKEDVLI